MGGGREQRYRKIDRETSERDRLWGKCGVGGIGGGGGGDYKYLYDRWKYMEGMGQRT